MRGAAAGRGAAWLMIPSDTLCTMAVPIVARRLWPQGRPGQQDSMRRVRQHQQPSAPGWRPGCVLARARHDIHIHILSSSGVEGIVTKCRHRTRCLGR